MKKILLLSGLLLTGVSGEVLADIVMVPSDGCLTTGNNGTIICSKEHQSSQTYKHSNNLYSGTYSPAHVAGTKTPSSSISSDDSVLGGTNDSNADDSEWDLRDDSVEGPAPTSPIDRHRIYGTTPMPPDSNKFPSPTTEPTVLNGNTDVDWSTPEEETATVLNGGGNVEFDFGAPEAESSTILTGDTSVDFGTPGGDMTETPPYDSGEDSSSNFDAPSNGDSTVITGDASVDLSAPQQ